MTAKPHVIHAAKHSTNGRPTYTWCRRAVRGGMSAVLDEQHATCEACLEAIRVAMEARIRKAGI